MTSIKAHPIPCRFKLALSKKTKKPGAGDIAKIAAPKTAQFVYNALRIGPRLILRSAFELMRANMVTRAISAIALLSFDTFSLKRKRISLKQYCINVALAIMLLVGGTAGWVVGGIAVGLVFFEDAAINIVASVIGAGVFGVGASVLCERALGVFVSTDKDDMLEILSRVFWELSEKHGLSECEVDASRARIEITKELLNTMFAQEDRYGFAVDYIEGWLQNL